MNEIKRVEDILKGDDYHSYNSKCIICQKEFTLWFNGGELDGHDCCGHTYKLESPRTDFVICKNQAPTS